MLWSLKRLGIPSGIEIRGGMMRYREIRSLKRLGIPSGIEMIIDVHDATSDALSEEAWHPVWD